MRLVRLQFKIRTLMIATAAGAVLLGVGIAAARLKARSSYYRSRAADYAFREQLFARNIQFVIKAAGDSERADRECAEEAKRHSGIDRLMVISSGVLFQTQTINHKKNIARQQAKIDWYAMMRTRYEFADSHPWLSVGPDPIEPR